MNGAVAFTDRNLILLADENRFERRKALISIKQIIADQIKRGDTADSDFDWKKYAAALASSINDNIEVNRELAINVVQELLDSIPDCTLVLPFLVPELTKRLGQQEIVEPSEELRLETLRLLQVILRRPIDMTPYVDDFLTILQYMLRDSFHEVKKLACSLAQELAQKKLHRFYQNSESILTPLLSNLIHQHSKVRVSAVQAVGTVLLHSQGKLVDQTITPLTQRLFDAATTVRRSVIEVVGWWLLELPDRYSYHTKLLPLILSGLLDDLHEIRVLSEDLWDDIGLKYEKENEEQLKDRLDFEKGPPTHYPLGCKRPVLGCRELVYRSASRLLPALCRDLGDWQLATRCKAAGLIPILILHLEQSTTQHTQHLLSGLGTGLTDSITRIGPSTSGVVLLRLIPPIAFKDQPLPSYKQSVNQTGPESLIPRLPNLLTSGSAERVEALKVVQQLLLAAQLLGALVEAKLWWQLLKACLDRCTESTAPASVAGHLFLLAGLISGAPIDQLTSIVDADRPTDKSVEGDDSNNELCSCTVIHQIVAYLINNDFLSVISFGAKAALLECISVIVRRLEESVTRLKSSADSDSDGIEEEKSTILSADAAILKDTQLRSWLFEILLAVGAVWADNDSCSTDFGAALLQLTDEVMHRLASCERDYGIYAKDPDYESLPPRPTLGPESGQPYFKTTLLDPAVQDDLDRLYLKHMLPLFQRLKASQTESGSWHPRSVGLAIFSRCLQTAGPALLMNPKASSNSDSSNADSCLDIVLQLLEKGCRLDHAPGTIGTDKSPAGTDPLTLASEAEIRLRGLLLLTRLTDNGSIRTVLASPGHLSRCLTQLVLPACVWRAGRTAEAMRKAAVTCLVALLAAATSTYDIDESAVDSRTTDEVHLDIWLAEHVESVKRLLGPKALEVQKDPPKEKADRKSSLTGLSCPVLSLLLTRLGGLLEDDLEATRKMACLNLTLFFNGLLLPCASDSPDAKSFLSSPTWLSTTTTGTTETNEPRLPGNLCPLPNSFGDQVYRFYPNLVRRLNDAKDPIRLLITETLNAWLRLVHQMLVCDSSLTESENPKRPTLNPVHSAVIQDFLAGTLPHLDDASEPIRAAVARVIARLGQIAPELTRDALVSARERHRASDLCHQLVESIRLCE